MITVRTEDICGSPTMMSGVIYPEVWRDRILFTCKQCGHQFSMDCSENN